MDRRLPVAWTVRVTSAGAVSLAARVSSRAAAVASGAIRLVGGISFSSRSHRWQVALMGGGIARIAWQRAGRPLRPKCWPRDRRLRGSRRSG